MSDWDAAKRIVLSGVTVSSDNSVINFIISPLSNAQINFPGCYRFNELSLAEKEKEEEEASAARRRKRGKGGGASNSLRTEFAR